MLARTRAIDAWRSADARTRLTERLRKDAAGLAGHADDEAGAVIRNHDAGELRALVAELTPPQREALVLAYWADLPLATIAARLGVPESTAKSRVRLARNRLSRRLRPLAA